MFIPNIDDYRIILASESPRRHYLLKEIGLEFEIKRKGFVEETYPNNLVKEKIPMHIANHKADSFGALEDKEILRGINLEVKAGEVHAIMGPNGSGKSTLASVLAGRDLFEVTEGSVEFNGKDIFFGINRSADFTLSMFLTL